MKRLIATLFAVALLASGSAAQIGFGVKGGLNLATAGGTDVSSIVQSRTGFAAGAYLNLSLPFLFTIQPEVLYTTKGFVVEHTYILGIQPSTFKTTYTYSYLEIPVLVKYSLPVPVLSPSVYVGPAVGILMSAKSKYEEPGSPALETDVKSAVSSTDYGLVVGASAHVLVADVEVRYEMGLTSTDGVNKAAIYNRVWSFMIGIPVY